MIGIQYICDEAFQHLYNRESPIYVVKKIKRKSERSYDLIDIYYCIEGVFYKSPDFFELVKTRYQKFSHHVTSSFEALSDSVEYELQETVTFPDEREEAEKRKNMSSGVFYEHSIISQHFPSMIGAFDDIEKHVKALVESSTSLGENNSSLELSTKVGQEKMDVV
jgi:hypothetical protein